jgi:hypothetical protein
MAAFLYLSLVASSQWSVVSRLWFVAETLVIQESREKSAMGGEMERSAQKRSSNNNSDGDSKADD